MSRISIHDVFGTGTPLYDVAVMEHELLSWMRVIAPTDPALAVPTEDVIAVAGQSARATVRAGFREILQWLGER